MKIADRIVRALISFAVIPVAFFTGIIHWIYDLPMEIINSDDNGLTEDNYSLYRIYSEFIDGFNIDLKEVFTNSVADETLAPLVYWAKFVGVFFIITLVIALVSSIFAIVTSKKTPSFICGGLGIASLIGMMVSFNKMVEPILSKQITLGNLLDIPMIGAIVDIKVINLSTAWVFMLILFIGLILWSASFILTSDKTETKKGKK